MAKFDYRYTTKNDFVTALGSRDYIEFTTDEFDGRNRDCLYVPSLNSIYMVRTNGAIRLLALVGVTMFNKD